MTEFAEFVALLRDIAIIAAVVLGIGLLFLLSVTAFFLYRKMAPILDSIRRTTQTTEEGSKLILEKILRPLAGNIGASYGVGRVVGFLLGLRRRKGGKGNGQRK